MKRDRPFVFLDLDSLEASGDVGFRHGAGEKTEHHGDHQGYGKPHKDRIYNGPGRIGNEVGFAEQGLVGVFAINWTVMAAASNDRCHGSGNHDRQGLCIELENYKLKKIFENME